MANPRCRRSATVSPPFKDSNYFEVKLKPYSYLWILQIAAKAQVQEGTDGTSKVQVAQNLGVFHPELKHVVIPAIQVIRSIKLGVALFNFG